MIERALVLVPVALLAIAQVMLKSQATASGAESTNRWHYLQTLAMSPMIWGALLLVGASFVAWMLLLQRYPLSHIYPAVSLTFPLVALLCHAVLGERIVAMQAIGLALIVMGVAVTTYYGHGAQ
jgi:drug/metabolite transporter (DMT)-like permease